MLPTIARLELRANYGANVTLSHHLTKIKVVCFSPSSFHLLRWSTKRNECVLVALQTRPNASESKHI